MFIIFLDYVLQMSIDLIKENGFTLKNQKQEADNILQNLIDSDVLVHLANTTVQAKSLLHILEQTAVNTNKREFMCFKQEGAIFPLSGRPLKFTHLSSNIPSHEQHVNICLVKK